MDLDRRASSRFVVSLPIRVEWKDDEGQHIVEEGLTENVGPEGTLVHLPRALPPVGSQVKLVVFEVEGKKEVVKVEAEVLRLVRNAAHPQAALKLIKPLEKWLKNVYESEAVKLLAEGTPDDYED